MPSPKIQLLGHSTTMELQSVHDLCFKVLYIYIYIVAKDTSHYDYSSWKFKDYGICGYNLKYIYWSLPQL